MTTFSWADSSAPRRPAAPTTDRNYDPSGGERQLARWGYADTTFEFVGERAVRVTGGRYRLSGYVMEGLLPFVEDQLGLKLAKQALRPPRSIADQDVPAARRNPALLRALQSTLPGLRTGEDARERLAHSHGQLSVAEVYGILYGELPVRVVDLVAYPTQESEVAQLVQLALEHGACLLPYGGGTNVSGALQCPPQESRTIISVDLRGLDRLLHVDPVNQLAQAQAGIDGKTLERLLNERGFTLGHEPDSIEFSTLGGWIATHASGMKKNRYGNIEDIVHSVTLVTPRGEVVDHTAAPRQSAGTSPLSLVFGSEGNLGVVTRAVFTIHPLPQRRDYGALVFRNFSQGLEFLRRLREEGDMPASIRLVSNKEFRFGQALKPTHSGIKALADKVQKLFLVRVKGFDLQQLAACTIVLEGSDRQVAHQKRSIRRLAREVGALDAGATNGKRGYMLTFGIAYIRDFMNQFGILGETFETTMPWSNVETACAAVHQRLVDECSARGIRGRPYLAWRVTQTYASGVCIYFTMAFNGEGLKDPAHTFHEIESALRGVIMDHGGSVSHHHGVGKVRSSWLPRVHSPAALALVREVKQALDPANVFAAGNGALAAQADVEGVRST